MIRIEENKPERCDACYFDTKELTHYEERCGGNPGGAWLCNLCASSMAGNVYQYPKVYGHDLLMIAGFIMNAANHILEAIKECR